MRLELELRSAEREQTKIYWRSDPKGAMGSSRTVKLVSIGLLLLMAYCIAIVRQAMQTSVPSRHSECEPPLDAQTQGTRTTLVVEPIPKK